MAPLLVAALVTVSCADDDIFDGKVHKVTKAYLQAVSGNASPTAFYGNCDGHAKTDAHRVLADEGAGFAFKLTGSVESDDSATVNVTVTGRDGSPSPYNVDLREEGGTWVVCNVSTGSVSIDVDF